MRSFREAILYEKDGSLNLGWLFLVGLLLCIVGAIIVSALGHSIPDAGWICLQVSFLAVLGASTTQNKAKIDAAKPDKPAE